VGLAAGYKLIARPRRHGHGRCENDRHDRGVCRVAGDVSDVLVGSLLGSVIGLGLMVALSSAVGEWVAKRASGGDWGRERRLRWA